MRESANSEGFRKRIPVKLGFGVTLRPGSPWTGAHVNEEVLERLTVQCILHQVELRTNLSKREMRIASERLVPALHVINDQRRDTDGESDCGNQKLLEACFTP
jgi:hypothetical protein